MRLNFQEFFCESFSNLFINKDDEKRRQLADQIHSMVGASYQKATGQQNLAFGMQSPEAMLETIPFWKIAKRDGRIRAVILYKDKNGRKSMAIATDSTKEGKNLLKQMLHDDMIRNRAYSEISDPSLSFRKKILPANLSIQDIAIPFEEVQKMMPNITRPPQDDPHVIKHPELEPYFYQREFGGDLKTKIMVGQIGNEIS
jgi:hypothetical protein